MFSLCPVSPNFQLFQLFFLSFTLPFFSSLSCGSVHARLAFLTSHQQCPTGSWKKSRKMSRMSRNFYSASSQASLLLPICKLNRHFQLLFFSCGVHMPLPDSATGPVNLEIVTLTHKPVGKPKGKIAKEVKQNKSLSQSECFSGGLFSIFILTSSAISSSHFSPTDCANFSSRTQRWIGSGTATMQRSLRAYMVSQAKCGIPIGSQRFNPTLGGIFSALVPTETAHGMMHTERGSSVSETKADLHCQPRTCRNPNILLSLQWEHEKDQCDLNLQDPNLEVALTSTPVQTLYVFLVFSTVPNPNAILGFVRFVGSHA